MENHDPIHLNDRPLELVEYRLERTSAQRPGFAVGDKIGGSIDAARIARSLIGTRASEVSLVLLLDSHGRLLGYSETGRGAVDHVMATTREIMATVILSGAAGFITAHNHPSADAKPSKNDLKTYRATKVVAEILSLNYLDNLIVTDSKYVFSSAVAAAHTKRKDGYLSFLGDQNDLANYREHLEIDIRLQRLDGRLQLLNEIVERLNKDLNELRSDTLTMIAPSLGRKR